MFQAGNVVIATRHAKARAIRPAFLKLGLAVRTVRADTDALGTFTAEVERTLPPLKCALEKCRLAHVLTGAVYCLGSEGSFGPHPYLPFAASAHEVLAFTDYALGYSVHEQVVTFETNFAAEDTDSVAALKKFAQSARFPSHALVLRAVGNEGKVVKGIRSWDELLEAYHSLHSQSATREVNVATDMRAHMNPTRMRVIASLARKLVRRLGSACLQCGAPGFGLIDTETGLPCAWCGQPTELVRREIHGCARCGHKSYEMRSDGLQHADPAHCNYCNP